MANKTTSLCICFAPYVGPMRLLPSIVYSPYQKVVFLKRPARPAGVPKCPACTTIFHSYSIQPALSILPTLYNKHVTVQCVFRQTSAPSFYIQDKFLSAPRLPRSPLLGISSLDCRLPLSNTWQNPSHCVVIRWNRSLQNIASIPKGCPPQL